jgi:hypothetical protein
MCVVLLQPSHSAKRFQLDQACTFHYNCTKGSEKIARRYQGAPRGNQVVDYKHSISRRNCCFSRTQRVFSMLLRILLLKHSIILSCTQQPPQASLRHTFR